MSKTVIILVSCVMLVLLFAVVVFLLRKIAKLNAQIEQCKKDNGDLKRRNEILQKSASDSSSNAQSIH